MNVLLNALLTLIFLNENDISLLFKGIRDLEFIELPTGPKEISMEVLHDHKTFHKRWNAAHMKSVIHRNEGY